MSRALAQRQHQSVCEELQAFPLEPVLRAWAAAALLACGLLLRLRDA